MHEDEFAMRAINAGLSPVQTRAMCTILIRRTSKFDAGSGVDLRRQYYLVKNILMILVMHFPFSRLLFRIPRIIIGRIVFGLKSLCCSYS